MKKLVNIKLTVEQCNQIINYMIPKTVLDIYGSLLEIENGNLLSSTAQIFNERIAYIQNIERDIRQQLKEQACNKNKDDN